MWQVQKWRRHHVMHELLEIMIIFGGGEGGPGKTWVKERTAFFLSFWSALETADHFSSYFNISTCTHKGWRDEHIHTVDNSSDQWMIMENNIPMCYSSVPRIEWTSSPSCWVLHSVSVKCTRNEEFKCKRKTPEILDMSTINSIPSCIIYRTELVMDILFFSFLQV